MDYDFGYIQTESEVVKRHSSLLRISSIILLGVASFGAYLFWFNNINKSELSTDTPSLSPSKLLTSYGLDGITASEDVISGYIYYSVTSPRTETEDFLPYSYRYDIENGSTNMVAFQPMYSINPQNNENSLVISSKIKNYTSNSWQPHQYNLKAETLRLLPNVDGHNVRDLSISPDGSKYAYSYQVSARPSPALHSLADWNIAIHTFGSDEVVIIKEASKLEWLVNESDVLYLSFDGIYRYNLETKEVKNIFNTYGNYTSSDDIAISAEGDNVILVIPANNLLSVLNFNTEGVLVEAGRIVSNNIGYSYPVFAPDNKNYAVIASKFTGSETNLSISYNVEIRNIANSKVEKSISLPGDHMGVYELKWFVK